MTKSELIEKIENGSDILFDIGNEHYVIFTWHDKGIAIGEQFKTTPMEYFDTAKELVDNFKPNGTPLSKQCDKVVITEYS